MPSTGLKGPYDLTAEKIDEVVTETSAGAYALGKISKTTNTFIPKYVGRSDDDVNKRLKDWVDKYPNFKYEYYSSAKAAYEKECRLYHDWKKQIDNKVHPAKSEGTDWKCPVCGK
jgi:hypothetical protein